MQGHITQVIFAGGFPPELGTKPGTNPFFDARLPALVLM